MNVALCYESVIPSRGGCETYVADLLRRLAADGHETWLYATRWDPAALPARLNYDQVLCADGPRFLRPWFFARASAKALARADHDVVVGFVKTWRQDVILPQGGLHLASVAGNLRKHRQPLERALARVGKWLSPAHWSFALLERWQYLNNPHLKIVVASHMVAEQFDKHLGIAGDRVRVIPNAIDPLRFASQDRLKERAALRDELGIHPNTPVGLFVGHNYRLKGLEPLLEAVARLPATAFHLLACGSANYQRFQRLAQRLGIAKQVSFLGYVADVRRCFFAADFLVHPTFYDPGSLVVMEALACNLPVITSRYNGAAELLQPPVDGIVLDDPWDVDGLRDALLRCVDPIVRRTMAKSARATAARWTFELHYQALLDVLQEVASQKRAA